MLVAQHLPTATDPCGQINYSVPLDNNDKQYITRVDYQLSANHTIFGRYIDTFERRLPTLSRTGNVLTVRREFGANKRARAQSSAFGDTMVLGANMVNSFRVTWNRTSNHLNDPPDTFFDAPDLGIKLHTYVPGVIGIAVTNAFTISGGNSVKVRLGQRVVSGGGRLLVGARPPSVRVRRNHVALDVRRLKTTRGPPAISTSTARRPAWRSRIF